MCPKGINSENLVKYDGVFKTGLEIQDKQVLDEQLFDFNGSNNYLAGGMIQVDKSGLYKPFPNAGSSLMPTPLHPHGILDKPDEVYTDENGVKCKVYKNDDGSYQVEKSNDFLGRLFGKTEIEQYDANGNLIAKQKDGVTYFYDENGNLTKTSEGSLSAGKVVLYNEDGSIKAESESKLHPNGEGRTVTKKEYNEDGSYTQTVQTMDYSLSGTNTKTTVQTFDKNGNPTSAAEEVDSQSYSFKFDKEKVDEIMKKIRESNPNIDVQLSYEKIGLMLNKGLDSSEIIKQFNSENIVE